MTQSITDSSRVLEGMYGQSLRSPPSARRRRRPHPRSAFFCSSLYRRFSCSWKPRTTRRWRVSPKKMLYSRCVEFFALFNMGAKGSGRCESFMQASATVSPGAGQPAGLGLRFAGLGCGVWRRGKVLSQRHFRLCCGNRGKQLPPQYPRSRTTPHCLAGPHASARRSHTPSHTPTHILYTTAHHGFRVGARAPRRQRCRERV